MTRTISHWIDGKIWDARPDRTNDIFDPCSGEVAAQVALAGRAEIDAAVAGAKTAFDEWKEVSLSRRVKVLFAFRELLDERAEELARSISTEHGKVLSDAIGEVARGQEVVEFACGIPHLLKGGYSESVSTGTDVHSIRQPLGVVAGITPFNFPAMVPMWMFPIAIACGNTFILKPSERDPSASLVIAELWAEAGLPEGVFTVLQGDKQAVDGLLAHPDVRAVSFVGSTPIARYVYETAAANGKRVQALGGAKNHMIVLPDADIDAAADAAVSAGYGSSGERCMAISVVVAVDPVGDALVDAIAQRSRAVRTGPTFDEASEMGPLITAVHRDKVVGFVESGIAEGAELVVDGREVPNAVDSSGFFLGPCLFDGVTPEMSIYREEIFGPVLSVIRVANYEEAVRLVSDNPYGNGVALFTRDGGAARRFEREVDAGMVGINVPIPVPMAYYSFGGWKQSLFGDTHVHGPEGVHFYTRGKVVTSRWADPGAVGDTGRPDLGFPTNA
ncbi:MAG: CoA-acylating methylmalonate-semialdehyde dehydrogenase [Acidimicrobiia bacterium]|nr:CoA-acylating methylmalonate-semialdehyde dehydrogenase [Acidimicrobiia bacterium]